MSKSAIRAEQPLLFPIYNKNGILLAEKGSLLTRSQVQKLEKLSEIFTLHRALETTIVSKYAKTEERNSIYRLPPPLERLETLEELLFEVYSTPNSSTCLSKILTLVNRLQTICEKSPDAAIAKIITDTNDNYSVKHPLHTAILCELAAGYLNWDIEEKRNIIAAALTMNLSLGMIQNKLLDQPQPLSLEQQQVIHDHPEETCKLLKKIGVQNSQWIDYVLKHHETIDGKGYPSGLTETDIPMAALLINLSDVYCAKVSGRSYREPIFANVAARDIYLEKDNTEKGTLIEVFVKTLGLYPPGCLVRLENDELAIVVSRGNRVDTPIVRVLSSNPKNPLLPKVKRNTQQNHYGIKNIVLDGSIEASLDYNEVWPT